MVAIPARKRAIVFMDGQNLFHAARLAFGYTYPNYDPLALATRVCRDQGWELKQTRFYTGVPSAADNAFWNHFWVAKLGTLGHQGGHVFSRPLRYRNKTVQLPGGQQHTFLVGEEKGIDVRIAIDVIRLAARNQYDVAVIFSQDQDLSEAADEVRVMAGEQARWIKLASAFPFSPTTRNPRGINKKDRLVADRPGHIRRLSGRAGLPASSRTVSVARVRLSAESSPWRERGRGRCPDSHRSCARFCACRGRHLWRLPARRLHEGS